MSAPIIYKSSDANAPVMAGNSRTCMVNLFRKCLVDGYGEKLAAGWTMPFINLEETQACFRNNSTTGTGFFFAVDGSTTSTTREVKFSCYEAMSSESAGTFKIGGTPLFYLSTNTTTTPRPWILVATENWCYFFLYYEATEIKATAAEMAAYNIQNLFVGDFESLYPTDGFNFAFVYSGAVISVLSWGVGCLHSGDSNPSSSYPYTNVARHISGETGSFVANQFGLGMYCPASSNVATPSGSALTYDANLGLMASPVWISGPSAHTFRGVMPRLVALYNRLPVSSLAEQTIDGVPYLPVAGKYPTNAVFELLFDLSV